MGGGVSWEVGGVGYVFVHGSLHSAFWVVVMLKGDTQGILFLGEFQGRGGSLGDFEIGANWVEQMWGEMISAPKSARESNVTLVSPMIPRVAGLFAGGTRPLAHTGSALEPTRREP